MAITVDSAIQDLEQCRAKLAVPRVADADLAELNGTLRRILD